MDGETDIVESCEPGNSEPSIIQNDRVPEDFARENNNENPSRENVIKSDESSDFQNNSEDVLVDVTNDKVNCLEMEYGSLVWVRSKGSRPWPAVVVEAEKCGLPTSSSPSRVMVFWLGDGRYTNVNKSDVTNITKCPQRYFQSQNSQYKKGVCQLLKYASERAGETLEADDFESLTQWAQSALKQPPSIFRPKPGHPTYPMKVVTCLQRIQKFNHSETDEGKKEWKKKGFLLRDVRAGRRNIEDICLSCPETDVKITAKHPIFFGGTCQSCEEDLQLDDFLLDEEDGKCMWCAVCAQPGPVHTCGNLYCERVFCINCIRNYKGLQELQDIKAALDWRCYACTPVTEGLLRLRNPASVLNKTQINEPCQKEVIDSSSKLKHRSLTNDSHRRSWTREECCELYECMVQSGNSGPGYIKKDIIDLWRKKGNKIFSHIQISEQIRYLKKNKRLNESERKEIEKKIKKLKSCQKNKTFKKKSSSVTEGHASNFSRSVSSDDPFVEEKSPDLLDDELSPASIRGIPRSSSSCEGRPSQQKEAPEDTSTSLNRNTGIARSPSKQKEIPEDTKSTSAHRNKLKATDYGTIIWCKIQGNPYWPAIICENGEEMGIDPIKDPLKETYICWYHSYSSSECIDEAADKVPLKDIRPFTDYNIGMFNNQDKIFRESVSEAIKDCSERANILGLSSDPDYDSLVGWFKGNRDRNIIHPNPDGDTYPYKIKKILKLRNIVRNKQLMSWKKKDELFKQVKSDGVSIDSICISCPSIHNQIVKQHEEFWGGMCVDCSEMLECVQETTNDDFYEYCRVCGSTEDVYMCPLNCQRGFCKICVRHLTRGTKDTVQCYVCKPYTEETHGLIKDRSLSETQKKLPNLKKRKLDSPVTMAKKKRVRSPIPDKRKVITDSAGPSKEPTNFASSSEELSLDSFSDEASSIDSSVSRTSKEPTEPKTSPYEALVWAQFETWRPSPAIIIDPKEVSEPPPKGKVCIFWLGYNQVGDISIRDTTNFVEKFKKHYVQRTSDKEYKRGIFQALQECHQCAGNTVNLNIDGNDMKSLVQWACDGFPLKIGQLSSENKINVETSLLSTYVSQYLSVIEKSEKYSKVREWKKKMVLLDEVRENRRDVKSVCITCPDVELSVVAQHPIFEGGLCNTCKTDREFMNKNTENEDKRNLCCVCVRPGEIVICNTCSNGYCESCIRLLVGPKECQNVKRIDPWECYLHNDNDRSVGLMVKRADWEDSTNILEAPQLKVPVDETPDISSFMPRRKMRVLSLFDGIGAGLVALHKLGIQVDKCYASEIDDAAINITSVHFSMESRHNKQQTEFIHVGDVENYTCQMIKDQGPFDLLVGGSPCNDLANVNPRRRGLFDPESSGQLFFHYFRILKEIQRLQGTNTHLFWLFENVFHMPVIFLEQISKFLDSDPVVVDARYFTAMRRRRNFWGNIPGMYDPLPNELLNNTPKLQNYLDKVPGRIAIVDLIKTVTSNNDCFKIGGNVEFPIKYKDRFEMPWIRELEVLFGFPKSWTDVGNPSANVRKAQLGRSWCVQVIMNILKPLKKYYLTDDDTNQQRLNVEDDKIANSHSTFRRKASELHTSVQQQNISVMSDEQHPLQSSSGRQSLLNSKDIASASWVENSQLEEFKSKNAEKISKIISSKRKSEETSEETDIKEEEVEVIDLSDSEIEDMEIDPTQQESTSQLELNLRPNPSPNVSTSRQTTPSPSISRYDEDTSDSKEDEDLPDLNDLSSVSSESQSLENNQSKEGQRKKMLSSLKKQRFGFSSTSPSTKETESSQNVIPGFEKSVASNSMQEDISAKKMKNENQSINNEINHLGETKLINACKKSKVDEVRILLLEPGIDVNIAENAGRTALHEAVLKNDVDCIQLLLDHRSSEESFRCDITKKEGGGMTALHFAVNRNHLQAADILLEYGGDKLLKIKNEDGYLPYDLTEDETIKDLLKYYEEKPGKLRAKKLRKFRLT